MVVGKNAIYGAREHRDRRHDFTDAFLDSLGDFDFAFASQQLHCAHFTHIHAHRVSGPAYVAFDSGQSGCGFFSCGFIGVVVCKKQGIGIGCGLEYVDSHVIDHANDVFDLLRIRNIFR